MPLPASGELSIGDIAGEFGGAVPHSLSEYYSSGGAPAGPEIAISDFYGLSTYNGPQAPIWRGYQSTGVSGSTRTFTLPTVTGANTNVFHVGVFGRANSGFPTVLGSTGGTRKSDASRSEIFAEIWEYSSGLAGTTRAMTFSNTFPTAMWAGVWEVERKIGYIANFVGSAQGAFITSLSEPIQSGANAPGADSAYTGILLAAGAVTITGSPGTLSTDQSSVALTAGRNVAWISGIITDTSGSDPVAISSSLGDMLIAAHAYGPTP